MQKKNVVEVEKYIKPNPPRKNWLAQKHPHNERIYKTISY